MNMKKIVGVLILLLFILSGCAPSSPPNGELTVYKDSCHIIGNDVYFSYNGAEFVAKNQAAGFRTQSQQNAFEITVIGFQDGSFIIPNN